MKNEKEKFKIGKHELYEDMILVDYIYPVLFTCVDDDDNIYIVACYCANSKEMKWLISKTTPRKIIDLLKNELSIREMFSEKYLWLGCQLKGESDPKVVSAKYDEIEASAFPTAGAMMDAEDGEFDTEIEELAKRLKTESAETRKLEYKIIPVMSIVPVRVDVKKFNATKASSKKSRKKVRYSVSTRTNAHNEVWA